MKFKAILLFLYFLTISAVPSNVYISRPDETKYYINQKPKYSSKWLEYDFHHMDKEVIEGTEPEDTYRLRKLSNITLTHQKLGDIHNTRKTLSWSGNWERAIQIQTDDGYCFMGGWHGYEKMTDLKIYMDGALITPKVGSVHTGQKLKIIEKSTLIHPLNIKTEIANITTTYVWNREVMTVRNHYTWNEAVKVNVAYAAMFPVHPSESISSRGYVFGQHSQLLYEGYTPIHADSYGGVFFNELNDLRLQCRIINPSAGLYDYKYNGDTKTYFKASPTFKKLYISLISPPVDYNTFNGLKWDFTAEYRLWNQNLK